MSLVVLGPAAKVASVTEALSLTSPALTVTVPAAPLVSQA